MTALTQAIASAAPDCRAGHITSPSQWTACWKIGWNEPTTGAAKAGYAAGHSVAPVLLGSGLVVLVLWLLMRSRSGSTATS